MKLHTMDKQVMLVDRVVVEKMPGLCYLLDIWSDFDDIIFPDVTARSVDHILDVIKHGSTAVFKNDIKEVIEAGKLFLNVHLTKDFTCQRYVGSSGEEIICILVIASVNVDFEKSEFNFFNTERPEDTNVDDIIKDEPKSKLNNIMQRKTKKLVNENKRMKLETQNIDNAPLKDEIFDASMQGVDFDDDKESLKNEYDQTSKVRAKTRIENTKKKRELFNIIRNENSRIRLFKHFKRVNSKYVSGKKARFPGLILDNKMTEWSVCLDCSEPIKGFKIHKCETKLNILKEKEIEDVDHFTRSMTENFKGNVRQVDVDKVKCKHCDFIMQSGKEVKNHLKSVHNMGYFICKYCGKDIENKNTLQEHELRKHGNTEHGTISCEFCGMTFVHNFRLRKHVFDAHENKRPFICDICSKTYKHKGKLADHLLTHSGEKNFLCTREECGKAFTTKTTLIQHERVHTGVKPYSCDECGQSFAQRNSLNVHNTAHHANKNQ